MSYRSLVCESNCYVNFWRLYRLRSRHVLWFRNQNQLHNSGVSIWTKVNKNSCDIEHRWMLWLRSR
jgi:hypothetical protein